MQEKSNILLEQEKTTTTETKNTPKCKTSPNCDFSTVKKQLTQINNKSSSEVQQQQRKLNAIIDSITFQSSPGGNELDQENRAPSEMSVCSSDELLTNSEMVETTQESDDSASDAGAVVGNFWSSSNVNNNKKINSDKQMSWRQNKRKQSRPLRCSTYLRDRNNSLDSAIDLGDHTSKDSEEDDDDYNAHVVPQSTNGCHVMEVSPTNGNGITAEENGNDYKYLMRNQKGLPCVFTIQPNQESDLDSPNHSDLESYMITENDMSERENGTGTPLSLSERDSDAEASTVSDALMDNVINIEPMSAESAAAAAAKEQDELEPGEVLNLRARALVSGGLSMVNRNALHGMPDLTSLAQQHAVSTHNSTSTSSSLPAPLGRTPLRHRRTIGELYGLMNPQRRGRGGATNHIAMKYRRDCPIPGCGARYLTNLCDHLKKTHGLGPEERRPWLEKAKRIHQQKQLQEQQQQLQSKSSPTSGTNLGSNHHSSSAQKSQRSSPGVSSTSSTNNPTAAQAAQAAAAAANFAASPALAAIALATNQSTANLSSTDSIVMAMSQMPLNSAALLMQQAQALSLLNAQAFPSPTAAFPGFGAAVSAQRSSAASAGSAFPSFGALSNSGVGTRVRSPWNSSGSRKNCPVPSCGAKSLLNLSDHLSKVHSMTRDERQPWLQRARDELA